MYLRCFYAARISLQFRHKFSMNYLNSLSNFVTIPDAGSCMIVSDKRMNTFTKGQLPDLNFYSKRQTTNLSFLNKDVKKDSYIFFLFLSPFQEKIAVDDAAAFSC